MKIIEKIFPNGGYYITSGWGYRTYWLNGKQVTDFHDGIDYGTNNQKLPQYAVEDGYIISCGIDTKYGNAKYVWVAYPRIGKKFLHYHLDSISVKKGQTVTRGTLIGYTGMTGYATGIHLHLGMKDINGGAYQNVEEYDYTEPTEINVGSKVKISTISPYKYYIADDVQIKYGIYQIRENLNAGGEKAFDWKDNGIPEACVDLVHSDGSKRIDSDKVHIKKGDKFVFAKTFTVKKVTCDNNRKYFLLDFDGNANHRFWVIEDFLYFV